ncbi:thiolase family protein [bacterium]|nr:thiolase family protein [bacterium]
MEKHPTPVIVSAARTPIGSFGGSLKSVPAVELGAVAIRAALERANVAPEDVEETILGMVLQAGVGQAPARQAAIRAGIPTSSSALTVNKVCSSGLKSIMLGAGLIQLGEHRVIIAGGMENMNQVPYYLPNAREGYRLGNGKVIDGMVNDGLWDPYGDCHMGNCAELCAKEKKVSREEQDAYAAESYSRAQNAIKEGKFKTEIAPVTIKGRKADTVVSDDEEPGRVRVDKIPSLRPAFDKNGTVTAANASSINDGGAAVVLMSQEEAEKRGAKPLARIVGWSTHSQEPEWFTTAPAGAVEKLLKKTGWKIADVDFFELNEAFAVVSIANNRMLGLDGKNVNIWGGAVALGHPIGASGCRILVTLLHVLKANNGKRGIASLCNGGGEATAVAVEML